MMKYQHRTRLNIDRLSTLSIRLIAITASMFSLSAHAVNLNYESLSSLEEPLATHYGDITFSLTGLADASLEYYSEADNDTSVLGNFQVSAETQLDNSWTLGAVYFGQIEQATPDNYKDNLAVYLGGVWGIGSLGNVTGLVRENTRRIRGAGNAMLSFDDHLGQLSDLGINYSGRFGPSQLLASIDDEGGFEIGTIYQRPLGNKDYRFSMRYRESKFNTEDALFVFDSNALSIVGALTYGSTVFNISLGIEQLENDLSRLGRQYMSLGATRKIGLLTLSSEAHIGDIEGQDERSYALGMKYDIARGLSLNLGLNYTNANVGFGPVLILQEDQTQGLLSVRYSI